MVQLEITKTFFDKNNHARFYKPGEVVQFEDRRAANIVSLGLGKYIVEPKAEAKGLFEDVETPAPEMKPETLAELPEIPADADAKAVTEGNTEVVEETAVVETETAPVAEETPKKGRKSRK